MRTIAAAAISLIIYCFIYVNFLLPKNTQPEILFTPVHEDGQYWENVTLENLMAIKPIFLDSVIVWSVSDGLIVSDSIPYSERENTCPKRRPNHDEAYDYYTKTTK